MASLYRKANWYRVLYVTLENGTEVELNSIIVYDKNGIIAKNEYGYFDNDKTIEIKGEIKRKIKVDFSKTENFVIKSKKDYTENRYDLYIYKDNASLQFLGFRKSIDIILADYTLNGGEFTNYVKSLGENKYNLKKQFEEEKALFEKNEQDTTTLTGEYISRSLELENERLDAIQELREKQNQADADSLAERLLITESGWTELIDTQMSVDKAIADSHEASLERQKELDREALKTRIGFYMEYAGSLQSILGTISDSWSDSIQSQLDTGEISEQEAKRQFEQIKQIQAAEAIINTIAGAVGVFMGISKDTGGWGIAAAIAKATAVLTAGMAQVAKIQSTTIGSKSASNQFNMNDAISNPQVNYTPTYTQNITNASETENLANALTQQPLKAYVVESDITNAQKRAAQRSQESTF